MAKTDYPLVLASIVCPVCDGPKKVGALTCKHFRISALAMKAMISAAERKLKTAKGGS